MNEAEQFFARCRGLIEVFLIVTGVIAGLYALRDLVRDTLCFIRRFFKTEQGSTPADPDIDPDPADPNGSKTLPARRKVLWEVRLSKNHVFTLSRDNDRKSWLAPYRINIETIETRRRRIAMEQFEAQVHALLFQNAKRNTEELAHQIRASKVFVEFKPLRFRRFNWDALVENTVRPNVALENAPASNAPIAAVPMVWPVGLPPASRRVAIDLPTVIPPVDATPIPVGTHVSALEQPCHSTITPTTTAQTHAPDAATRTNGAPCVLGQPASYALPDPDIAVEKLCAEILGDAEVYGAKLGDKVEVDAPEEEGAESNSSLQTLRATVAGVAKPARALLAGALEITMNTAVNRTAAHSLVPT